MSGNLVVHKLVRDFIAKGKYVGMICAGMSTCLSQREATVNIIPLGSLAALSSGLPSQPLTSHPSVKEDLQSRESHLRSTLSRQADLDGVDFQYSEEPVVVSGHLVTTRGPGTVLPPCFVRTFRQIVHHDRPSSQGPRSNLPLPSLSSCVGRRSGKKSEDRWSSQPIPLGDALGRGIRERRN